MATTKLKHADLEKFVTETLSKREPCPAMVLAWGWVMKQGEGGLFHGDSYKQRFFVLARVPHATVLIYYGEKTMDEENILGFIDLRRVQQVREVAKPVTLDGAKGSGGGGFMSKLFSRGGGSASARNVVELVTPGRIYNLAPATIAMPSPMTTSAALANAAGSKPLYLFGWPFPVPAMDGGDDEAEVAGAFVEGKLPEDSFTQWRDVLATAVAAEKATRTYPVTTLVDSTGQLPQRVFLRTTPCELAIVSMEDKDLCFAALPYNDLVKWDCPVEGEIHVTARTRARLVAKPDRSGFSSQRPTRSTCHFVFKCSEARGITSVIDNHLRALAKQLSGLGDGADEAEVAAAAAGSVAADDEAAAGAGSAEGAAAAGAGGEEGSEGSKKAAATKLMGKKPAARRAAASPRESSEEEESDGGAAAAKGKRGAAAAKGRGKKPAAAASSDEESEEEAKPARRKGKGKKPAAAASSEEDSEEEEAPKPKARGGKAKASGSKKKLPALESDEEESEEEAPKPKAKRASSKKKPALESDEDDE